MTAGTRRMAPVDEQMAVLMRGTEFGDEMTRRNMERDLRVRLEEDRPLSVYCGYDPTSVDLTLGHTLTMRKLRQFQDFGHQVTFLIGNFTGLVGDASDKDKRRPMLTPEQLAANAATYEKQAGRILDLAKTTITYNADWLGKLTFADVVKLCSHFTVAEFLKRDNFSKRLERGDAIHLHEFMYAIMQAYDAVALQTDVQVGGTEQLFNLMAGRKLQEEYGQRPQIVLMVPILVGTDGHQRMSKSTGNYIGVDEAPNDMYGKVMSLPDVAMRDYFTLLTDLSSDVIESQLAGAPIEAKKRLALEVTASMYDRTAAAAAQTYFESTFQRGETPEEMQEFAIEDAAGARLDRVIRAAGLAASAAEVRRLVAQGAVRVNGDAVTDFALLLHGGDEVRVGRHRFLRMVGAGGHE
ncbi:MAG: tyrosine--tRNA ligase [Dehalococcoidia bacterium]